MPSPAHPISLYVHVPFCEQKCNYCDFFTLTDPDHAHPQFDSWLDLCHKELQLWRQKFPQIATRPIGTIFFGGGTPSLLAPEQFERFIAALHRESPSPSHNIEITLETQPGTLAAKDYPSLVGAGITRFSVGVQTFNPELLLPTARRHTVADTEETLRRAKDTGATLSIDMICALPGQTMYQWQTDLQCAIDFAPQHLSVYEMTYHAGTDYHRKLRRGTITQTDENVRVEMFQHTRTQLIAAGYKHYEISNYAKPSFESRHNKIYWTLGDFIGLGAGAHSYLEGHRYENPRSARDYARAITENRLFIRPHDSPDPDITLVENLQMTLRLIDGVNLDWLAEKLNQDIRITRERQLKQLVKQGWVMIHGNRLKLTEEGQLHADSVTEVFL